MILDDNSESTNNLNKISKRIVKNKRPYKGFNFFSDDDQEMFETLASGEFNIQGFQNKNLRQKIKSKTSSQISRIIKEIASAWTHQKNPL